MKKVKTKEIKPFADRVLVRPFTKEDLDGKNRTSIILPESITEEKFAQGKVLAVGEGKYVDDVLVPVRVRVGDVVVFSKYGYDEIQYENEDLYLLKEDNILAVIK